jgi:hypothetical protein
VRTVEFTPDPIARFARVLWLDTPRRIIRRLPGLTGIVGDGYFLVTVPPVAVLAPFAASVGGLIVGGARLGYVDVYTESMLLMTVAIAIGCVSAQLGALAIAGFSVGEIFVAERSWSLAKPFFGSDEPFTSGLLGSLARVRLPLLISHLLLAAVVIIVPRTARAMALSVGRWRRIPNSLAWPVTGILSIVVVWIGTRTWTAAAPTLVRPRFTWLGSNSQPTSAAITPLQINGDRLVATAVIATMARHVWIGLTMFSEPLRSRLRRAEAASAAAVSDAPATHLSPPSGVAPHRSRRMLASLTTAGLATLTLAGILEQGWLWIAAFTTFATMGLVRAGLVLIEPVERWKQLTARIPSIVRLATAWILARVVTDGLSNDTIRTYTGLAVFVLAGSLVVFALFPGPPVHASARTSAPGPLAPPLPPPIPGSSTGEGSA